MHLSNSQLGGYAFSVGESMHQSMVYFLVTLGFFFVFLFFCAVLANCKLDQL